MAAGPHRVKLTPAVCPSRLRTAFRVPLLFGNIRGVAVVGLGSVMQGRLSRRVRARVTLLGARTKLIRLAVTVTRGTSSNPVDVLDREKATFFVVPTVLRFRALLVLVFDSIMLTVPIFSLRVRVSKKSLTRWSVWCDCGWGRSCRALVLTATVRPGGTMQIWPGVTVS